MLQLAPHFANLNTPSRVPIMGSIEAGTARDYAVKLRDDAAFYYPIENFYMTDPISRASRTMAECTKAVVCSEKKEAA